MAPPSSKTVAAMAVCAVAGVAIVYLSTKRGKSKEKIEPKTSVDTDVAAVTSANEPVEPPRVDRNLVIPEPVKEAITSNGVGEETKGSSEESQATTDTSAPPTFENEVKPAPSQQGDTNGKKTTPSKKKRRPKKKKQEAVDASLAKKNGAPSPLTETVPPGPKKEQAPEHAKEGDKSTDNATKTTYNTNKDDGTKNTASPSKRRKPRRKKPSTPKQNNKTEASSTTSALDNPNGTNDTAAILKQKTHKKKKPATNAAAAAAAKELKSFNESTKKKKNTTKR